MEQRAALGGGHRQHAERLGAQHDAGDERDEGAGQGQVPDGPGRQRDDEGEGPEDGEPGVEGHPGGLPRPGGADLATTGALAGPDRAVAAPGVSGPGHRPWRRGRLAASTAAGRSSP